MSSSESSEDFDRWQSVFVAVTDKELRLYESAPWSTEAWRSPAECYPLIATRLVSSSRRSDLIAFSVRCGTAEGVTTHHLRAETHRDLANWARALVNGSHASAIAQRELVCREYLPTYLHKIISAVVETLEKLILSTQCYEPLLSFINPV